MDGSPAVLSPARRSRTALTRVHETACTRASRANLSRGLKPRRSAGRQPLAPDFRRTRRLCPRLPLRQKTRHPLRHHGRKTLKYSPPSEHTLCPSPPFRAPAAQWLRRQPALKSAAKRPDSPESSSHCRDRDCARHLLDRSDRLSNPGNLFSHAERKRGNGNTPAGSSCCFQSSASVTAGSTPKELDGNAFRPMLSSSGKQ